MAEIEQEQVESNEEVQEQQEYSRYDFMHPHRLDANQNIILKLIHQNYAQSLEVELASFLKLNLSIQFQNTEQSSFISYAERLNNPSFICIFYIERLNGYGLIEVNPAIIFSIVDRMTGGSGTPPKEIKPFTDLELAVTEKFVDILVKELEKAWSYLVSITFEFKQIQTNPFLINLITAQELCVVNSLSVKLGDLKESMTVCVPYSNIEPLMLKAQNQGDSYTESLSKELEEINRKNLGGMSFVLKGILGELQFTMKELEQLQPGDILDTGKKRREGGVLRIGNVDKFKVHFGLVNKFRGISIVQEITRKR